MRQKVKKITAIAPQSCCGASSPGKRISVKPDLRKSCTCIEYSVRIGSPQLATTATRGERVDVTFLIQRAGSQHNRVQIEPATELLAALA